MKRLLVVLAVLSLLAASGGELGFHEKLAQRMARKTDRVFDWAEKRGVTETCIRMTAEGLDPDGEAFGWAYQVCQ